jgi:PKD repeat protein
VVLPSNHAPADLALGATAVVEGSSTTLTVSFSDAEATDTHGVAINWGDTSSESVALAAGATTTSATHTYLETGIYPVAVTVTDGGGLSVAGGTTVDVGNVGPSVDGLELSPSSVTDHQTVTVNASFTDPGTADTFAVSITWGDNTAASTQSLAAGTRSFSASHEYAAADTYLVTATVTDRDGDAGSRSTSVVVSARNTGPTGLALRPNVNGSTVAVSATFVDPDVLDTHTVTMSWGDRTTTWTLAGGTTSFSSSHAYPSSGTYTVSATVTDPSGESTSASVQVVVTVSAESVSELLDQMAALILSFDLDRNTEKWLVRRIDELKASLGSGNTQVCADLKILGKVSTYANRLLPSDQAAALSSLAAKLEAAAQCAGATVRPNDRKLPLVVAAKPPVVTPRSTDEQKSDKSEKSATSGNSVNSGNSEKPAASVGSSDADKKEKSTKAERKATKNSGDRD